MVVILIFFVLNMMGLEEKGDGLVFIIGQVFMELRGELFDEGIFFKVDRGVGGCIVIIIF